MPKLTKRIVDAATPDPSGRQSILWDAEVKGFGLRVTPAGVKSYILNYRTADGRERRITIGKHGSPWTCDEARGRAVELLREIAAGNDPLDDKAAAKAAMTVKELCKLYLDAADKGMVMGKGGRAKKESTLYIDRGRIDRHIIPLLGSRKVKDLTTPDINRFMRDVTAGKTAVVEKTKARGKAVVEGGAGTASRTVGLLGGILSFAVSEGIIATNPARGVKRPADNRRDVRMSPEDYQKLGEALKAAEEEAEAPQAVAAVWLLALTGCRRGEIEALKWSEVDEAGRCFRLKDSKEGASVRPMGGPVFDVLKQIGRRDDCDFVNPGTSGNRPYGGVPQGWKRIAKRAGLLHITPHILRHSFASVANDMGFTEPTIAAMLGHSVGSVTGRYIHHLDSALLAAADRVARRIQGFMIGKPAAEVVPITKGRKRKA
ncbi:MAG TPA: tyrosine-type recombinase/integrase [Azospirillaceae bacterium]|nr:tyrosine-type recombinase/integrase [Azospirillaceae bacterium]